MLKLKLWIECLNKSELMAFTLGRILVPRLFYRETALLLRHITSAWEPMPT